MMSDLLDEVVVSLAGRDLVAVWNQVRRYSGLPWSGGVPEVWAFAYYDAIPMVADDVVSSVDVVACAALHSGLSKSDLTFFVDEKERLAEWLRAVPVGVPLHELNEATLAHVAGLADWVGVNLSLLTKVLHRKRPDAIPMLEHHLIDLYRPVTRERAAAKAWPAITSALRADLRAGAAIPLAAMAEELRRRTECKVSALRVADIAVWMSARR